jgi:hypothetical protein
MLRECARHCAQRSRSLQVRSVSRRCGNLALVLDDIVTARPDRDVLLFELQSSESGDRRLIWIKIDRRCRGTITFGALWQQGRM